MLHTKYIVQTDSALLCFVKSLKLNIHVCGLHESVCAYRERDRT